MRYVTSLFFIGFMFLGLVGFAQEPKPKRVVVIGIDGLSVDGYKTAKHPNLDQLMKDGVLSMETRPVMPSVTMPNWTSHLTSGGPSSTASPATNGGLTTRNSRRLRLMRLATILPFSNC